jgi:hypothetical protein
MRNILVQSGTPNTPHVQNLDRALWLGISRGSEIENGAPLSRHGTLHFSLSLAQLD